MPPPMDRPDPPITTTIRGSCVPPAGGGSKQGQGLRILSGLTLASAYLLVVLGDTVRVTASGMGCRSWPLCNGHLGLVGSYHALLEQSHRYLAVVVTVLVAATFVAAWRRQRRHPLVLRAAAASVSLIGVQIALGAITVFAHNAGWTVALHLAGAWLLLAAITVTAFGVWRAPPYESAAGAGSGAVPAGRVAVVAVVAVFALAVSGMLVLHDGASRACPTWPLCRASSAPARLVALQYLHRTLGLLASVAVVAVTWRTWRSAAAAPLDRFLGAAVAALLALTAALGGIVATTGAPRSAQDLHLAAASALWAALIGMATPAARHARVIHQRAIVSQPARS